MINTKLKNLSRRLGHSTCMWGFGNLKQDSAGLQVPNLKPDKVDVVNVVLWFAEIAWKEDMQ